MKKKYVRICPQCKSADTQPDLSADSYAKGLLNQWKCNTCGYTGLVFPEYSVEDLKKMQKNP
jgi:transposase-like protein